MLPVLSSAAALLDGLFEHPAGVNSGVSHVRTIEVLADHNNLVSSAIDKDSTLGIEE